MPYVNSSDPVAQPGPVYPGGVDAPAYRLAFQVWWVLFLLIIIVGLVNYLAIYFK